MTLALNPSSGVTISATPTSTATSESIILSTPGSADATTRDTTVEESTNKPVVQTTATPFLQEEITTNLYTHSTTNGTSAPVPDSGTGIFTFLVGMGLVLILTGAFFVLF